jgi:DNA-binding NarL/FixJ family response regulator
MGITAIPGLLPATHTDTNTNTNNSTQSFQPANNVAADTARVDTVQLTEAQQVYQLYNQGKPVSQIAQALSLSVDEVNSYLNISNSGT